MVTPGQHDVEVAEAWLKLVQGKQQDAVLVRAQATTHQEFTNNLDNTICWGKVKKLKSQKNKGFVFFAVIAILLAP